MHIPLPVFRDENEARNVGNEGDEADNHHDAAHRLAPDKKAAYHFQDHTETDLSTPLANDAARSLMICTLPAAHSPIPYTNASSSISNELAKPLKVLKTKRRIWKAPQEILRQVNPIFL